MPGAPGPMRAFAEAGPAFGELARHVAVDWAAWADAADRLASALGPVADADRRIHQFYLPVLFFAADLARRAAGRPAVLGIQAPQGAGKSTLAAHLEALLPALGLRAARVSIDDFYLTHADQRRVAAGHPGNPYLEHRGYPGTHDIALGETTIAALAALGPERAGRVVRVPVYDKSRHGGRGDRTSESEWREVAGPLDLVFVEGWMLGFLPVPESRLPDPRLVAPNRALASYDRWHRHLDALVRLRALDAGFVLRWRVAAEEAMAAAGRPGLGREAIEDYVGRFLPAYAVYAGGPGPVAPDRTYTIWLDAARRPVPGPSTRA